MLPPEETVTNDVASPGRRPLIVGPGVISGILVVLLAMIEDIIEVTSTVAVELVPAANVVVELSVVLEMPIDTLRRIAVSAPAAGTVEFAETFR